MDVRNVSFFIRLRCILLDFVRDTGCVYSSITARTKKAWHNNHSLKDKAFFKPEEYLVVNTVIRIYTKPEDL